MLRVFNCGIGIPYGIGHLIHANKVLITPPTSAPATGIEVNGLQYSVPCGTITLSNNLAYAIQSDGTTIQGYYSDGFCTPITLTSNTFDATGCAPSSCAALNALNPMAVTNRPPQIPPLPHGCIADSPYSNASGMRRCA